MQAQWFAKFSAGSPGATMCGGSQSSVRASPMQGSDVVMPSPQGIETLMAGANAAALLRPDSALSSRSKATAASASASSSASSSFTGAGMTSGVIIGASASASPFLDGMQMQMELELDDVAASSTSSSTDVLAAAGVDLDAINEHFFFSDGVAEAAEQMAQDLLATIDFGVLAGAGEADGGANHDEVFDEEDNHNSKTVDELLLREGVANDDATEQQGDGA